MDASIANPALSPAQALGTLVEHARGLDDPETAREAEALLARTGEGRAYVAILGEFKRGKSSLLNAIVGRPVLAVGLLPVTTVLTAVRWGKEARAEVRFLDGRVVVAEVANVGEFVAEAENPGNAKRVALVELFLPNPLLERGVTLVDTPGIGSTSVESTEIARHFVPHLDAAILVVGAEPPITGDEVSLLARVAAETSRILVALNKADRLTDAERHQALEHTRRVLSERFGERAPPVVAVSARDRADRGAETFEWPRLDGFLDEVGREAGSGLAQAALVRGVRRLSRRLLLEANERRLALHRPLSESEARVERLRGVARDAERAGEDLTHLLGAEQRRIVAELVDAKEAFVREHAQRLRALVGAAPSGDEERSAKSEALRLVEDWRATATREAEGRIVAGTRRFVEEAARIVGRLAENISDATGEAEALEGAALPERSRYYFDDLPSYNRRLPGAIAMERLLPTRSRSRRERRRAAEYAEALLSTNATRVVNDLDVRVEEARRRLERRLEEAISLVLRAAERSLLAARASIEHGQAAVQGEVARLDQVIATLEPWANSEGALQVVPRAEGP